MKTIKLIQPIAILATAVLISGCSAKKIQSGDVYYKEAQIVERKVAVKCTIEKCQEPIDLRLSKEASERVGDTYANRASALRTYVHLLEQYNQCLYTQLQLCTDSNSTSASAVTQ